MFLPSDYRCYPLPNNHFDAFTQLWVIATKFTMSIVIPKKFQQHFKFWMAQRLRDIVIELYP